MQPLSSHELQKSILAALRAWGDLAGNADNLLADLLLVQREREKMTSDSPTTRRLATNRVLTQGINTLKQQDPSGAEILSLRFMDEDTVLMVGRKFDLSQDQVKRRQRKAIENLAQIIWEQETAVRSQRAQHLQAKLMPADYTRLFGTDAHCQQLLAHLQQPALPWVIAVIGIGGIGKTALVDHVTRQIIHHFIYEEVVWLQVNPVRVRTPVETMDTLLAQLAQTLCPQLSPQAAADVRNQQLRQTLKSAPHLVVIDNLESEADAAFMADVLNDLANPSKFLLTSRVRLPASSAAASLLLAELSADDAAALIRHQAQAAGLPDLADAPTDELHKIYAVTGGNPLAIKLVVGLTAVYPLPRILADLKEARTTEIEQLYRRIYWQAWHSLSENSQVLLEMMPMAAENGATPAQLQAMSGLDEMQLWPAINELVNRSLLEVRGSAWERRYTIHRLTESFLYTEIIHWPEDS